MNNVKAVLLNTNRYTFCISFIFIFDLILFISINMYCKLIQFSLILPIMFFILMSLFISPAGCVAKSCCDPDGCVRGHGQADWSPCPLRGVSPTR